MVFKYHFDYAPEALTSFERHVMKRLFPFYTWFRNNIPLQISELVKKPGKFITLAKTQRAWNQQIPESKEELAYIPNWMKEMFLLRLPTKERAYYLQLDLPVDDLSKLPLTESGRREIFSMLSPALKFPIEIFANKNIYFDSPIHDKELPKDLQTSRVSEGLKILPEPIKKFLNFKSGVRVNYRTKEYEPYFEMDSVKLYIMRSFLSRFYSTFDQAIDKEMPTWAKYSRLILGMPVREIEIEEEKFRREKEFERILREMSTYYKQRQVLPYETKRKTDWGILFND